MEEKEPIFEYLESIAELIPAPFYWLDKNAKCVGLNTLSMKSVGALSKMDLIGKTAYEIYKHKDISIAVNLHVDNEKVLCTGKSSQTEDITIDIITSKIKYYSATRAPLRNKKGEIIGIVGASIDITAEKEKLMAEKKSEILKLENIKLEAENKLIQIIIEKNAAEIKAERLNLENEKHKVETERLRFETAVHKLENEKHQLEALQQARFRKIAAQVAHDIASPIFALQMILPRCDVLPENTRNALSKFSIRIMDIAQNFLSQFKQKSDDSITIGGITRTDALIYSELIEIVTEKKYEYSNCPIKFTPEINPNSYFTFVNIDVDAFKRMVSNLINNSVDALEAKDGSITIHLDTIADRVQIIIEDNGKGIPKEVLEKIRNNISVTLGKIDGHGIGFSQIRDTILNNRGTLSIDSQIGHGTKVSITFPKTRTPTWITEKITLNHDDLVVIVDDEPYIHEAWECKFRLTAPNLLLKHFEQGAEVIKFLNQLPEEEKQKIFLLTDYELLNQKLNGLDIINKTGIKRSVLVTSHHNDQEIRDLAMSSNTKILPKELAFAATITL